MSTLEPKLDEIIRELHRISRDPERQRGFPWKNSRINVPTYYPRFMQVYASSAAFPGEEVIPIAARLKELKDTLAQTGPKMVATDFLEDLGDPSRQWVLPLGGKDDVATKSRKNLKMGIFDFNPHRRLSKNILQFTPKGNVLRKTSSMLHYSVEEEFVTTFNENPGDRLPFEDNVCLLPSQIGLA